MEYARLVISEAIQEVRYNTWTHTTTIVFVNSSREYTWTTIPWETTRKLMEDVSPGSVFNYEIRGVYFD